MIWLSWRQFRSQAFVVAVGLVAVAIAFAITGPSMAHYYDTTVLTCGTRGDCNSVTNILLDKHHLLQLLGTVLVAVPGLLGVFWGAPLVARELETGTFRLAWTQSVTRTRWLAVKLVLIGGASMLAAGLLSLMISWWSSPLDAIRHDRFGAGNFAERGVVPISYAAFGFALGVAAGVLIRRTLPAMVTTMFAFLAIRVSWTLWVRSHLIAPSHLSSPLRPESTGFGRSLSGPMTLQPGPPDLPNAWIYSTRIVDNAGHGLTTQVLSSTCPQLGNALTPPPGGGSVRVVPDGVHDAVTDCVKKIGANYHMVVTYQPASRYWLFQWYEAAIFMGFALALAGFSFWWIRRRIS